MYTELFERDVANPILTAQDWPYPAHTVFNAGLGLPWAQNRAELRYFTSIAEWSRRLEGKGFRDMGKRLRQQNDPSDNLLLAFTKPA